MTESRPHDTGQPLGHVTEWDALAVDYLAGLLSPAERDAVQAHLDACTSCADEVAKQRAVVTLLRGAPAVTPPPAIEARVLQAYAELHAPDLHAPDLHATFVAGAADGAIDGRAGAGPDDLTPAGGRPAEDSPAVGWRRRLTGFLDLPTVRKLTPALAATLILVVSLVGLTQLSPGELTQRAADDMTTAAALETQASSEAPAATVDDAQTAGRDESTQAPGAAVSTTSFDQDATTTAPGATAAESTPGETLTATDTTASAAGTLTTAPGTGAPDVVPMGPASAVPVAYVTVTTGETTAGAGDLVRWTTGLTPLPSDLWLGAPTYAAYMAAATLDGMTQGLAAQGVRLSISLTPPPGTGSQAGSIAEAQLPTLTADSARIGGAGDTSDSPPPAPGLVLVVLIAR